jgi:FAD/FMN-containing dehydrogenase
LPFLPAATHGKEVVVFAIFYNGEQAEGERLVQPLRQFGNAIGEHVGAMPYTQWQQTFDPLLTPGARNYWKSHNFTRLSDGLLDTIIEYAGTLASAECEIFLGLLAGAANEVPVSATAYSARDAKFVINVHGRWQEAEHDDDCIAWSRAFFKAATPYASSGAYVNFMTADEGERVAAAYGANYTRLLEIKQRYDPENIFHLNQNIRGSKPIAGGRAQRRSA